MKSIADMVGATLADELAALLRDSKRSKSKANRERAERLLEVKMRDHATLIIDALRRKSL